VSQKVTSCLRCEHRVVLGVACDGLPRACPHQAVRRPTAGPLPGYAASLARWAGVAEHDAVRSDG
jgi:hypothetical protein